MLATGGDETTIERASICFPKHGTDSVIQQGDAEFPHELGRWYAAAESQALEALVELKTQLRTTATDEFFGLLTEGMSRILGAEMCFVMKRMLADDHGASVEMPPIGEPGSCLMAAALHYCDSDNQDTGTRHTLKSTKFSAWGCPCAYMRHDKVFLLPERLEDLITNNPNTIPYPCEAYIAVPLKSEGKSFAHFGAMWSTKSAAVRKLSWAVIELLLHSLEDMIMERLLEGSDFVKSSSTALQRNRIIPHEVVTAAQSLRPYAGSLSHELRTPMQGVVGMLDIMYATVQEAAEGQGDPKLQEIFRTLQENIEAVQDSSRRAVEAADNVVHAYDMNMSVPDVSKELLDDLVDPLAPASAISERRPEILVAGSDLPISRPNKRRRDDAFARSNDGNISPKRSRVSQTSSTCQCSESSKALDASPNLSEGIPTRSTPASTLRGPPTPTDAFFNAEYTEGATRVIPSGLRHTSLHEVLQHVISEGLKVGGRPEATIATPTELGEIIEVRCRRSDGTVGTKIIQWSVDPNVPETLFVDEQDLSRLVSRVFLNAIKFTDSVSGRIRLHARMSHRGRYISIRVTDNGSGISAAYLPRLFKPFSQEDPSLTRASEGLGLGLMVAKGIARKLGGDLVCNRTETEGADHGTEFEIKVPIHAGEPLSRPSSPFGSPLPRKAQLANVETPQFKPLSLGTPLPGSPYKWARALHNAVNDEGLPGNHLPPLLPSTPPTPPSPRSLVDVDSLKLPISLPPALDTKAAMPPRKSTFNAEVDSNLATKYPLNFLVAEDNKINRKLLVTMLRKLGYKNIQEAHDGAEAVQQMFLSLSRREKIDIVLMDLWMPLMDGYEATERILKMDTGPDVRASPTVLAVTADITDGVLERTEKAGMKGFMSKPYMLKDLQQLITRHCATQQAAGGELVAAAA